jgi:hypothetical protein
METTTSVVTTAAAAAGNDGSDDEAAAPDDVLDAPPEPPLPPDAWQFGGQAGVHCLDTSELVRQLCSILMPPSNQQQHQQHQHQHQQQQPKPAYDFFAFHFDTVAIGSAAGAAAQLPKGPTAAKRRDSAVRDKQSSGVGVRLDGVAISWCNGQAFYVPLHRREDLLAELSPLFRCPRLEKATWDLRGQMAALAKLLGRGVLGVPGLLHDAGLAWEQRVVLTSIV